MKILKSELKILALLILCFAPAITTLILALNIDELFSLILISYIFIIPLIYMILENSSLEEWLNEIE